MSDWPELERRLVESARRRRPGRRWRFALIPVSAAVATVAVLVAASAPSDERAIVPADERVVLNEPTGPGIHDTVVDAVLYGAQPLRAGTVNRLSYAKGQGFTVGILNRGENDESDLRVSVHLRPVDGEPVTLTRTLPDVAAGGGSTIEFPLDREPPIERALTVDVTVALVPGETNAENNRTSYPVLFDAGAEPEPPTDAAVQPVDVADLRDTEAVQADLASGGELARAWKVPALKGHVHLIRKPDGWCLSVPDPLTDLPEIERGKTCTDAATFADRGIQIGIGSTSVSVASAPDAPLRVVQR